jgi:hypothetical protein
MRISPQLLLILLAALIINDISIVIVEGKELIENNYS